MVTVNGMLNRYLYGAMTFGRCKYLWTDIDWHRLQ